MKYKNTKVNIGMSNFHLLSFYVPTDASINHPVDGTGRRSVPSLKPTLIAILLPLAAGMGAIAAAADGSAAGPGTATEPAVSTAGAKDQTLEEIVVTGLRASLE